MWMPSTPGTPASIAARTASSARATTCKIVADEGRQETGRAETPVRLADRANGVDRRLGVEEDAAAAIDLGVDKARQQQMAAEVVAGGATATRVVAGDDVDDPAAVEQDGAALEDAVVAEHAAVDECDGHQTVSVTLRRCGGRSGSRPRELASALANR